ncbi:MAG: hypothetical protein FJY73_08145 [Candidatus Eisenbacteria bacterium]|nr:hypothetical protein [Candidatus Eisenbacteria bacterium]
MMVERILVGAIVCGAAFFVARAVRRSWSGKSKCGCGARCPVAREAASRALRVIRGPRAGENLARGPRSDRALPEVEPPPNRAGS